MHVYNKSHMAFQLTKVYYKCIWEDIYDYEFTTRPLTLLVIQKWWPILLHHIIFYGYSDNILKFE